MDIVNKNINDITPYVNNPRNNDAAVNKVAASIGQFGFKVPIVIDKNGIIVAGHTRHKAAQKIGLKEVPCIIADDLTPDQIKAFRLVDNKTAEYATWDTELLDAELEGLDIDLSEFDFELSDGDVPDIEDFKDPDIKDKKTCQCPKCGFEWCEK